MSQTLVIRTPDAVSTTSRVFPKQGMFNLKITKNYGYDTVEIWVRSGASNITLELAGASFLSTAQGTSLGSVPSNPTVISGSTLELTQNVTQYMKIKLNKDISVAYLRCSYAAKSEGTTVTGGNISGQAYVDYSKKPYISMSLERMFTTYPVRNDLTKWDVSSVASMQMMFMYNQTFNQPIGNWDVSNVTSMQSMFSNASSFNQPLNNWDVSKVTTMSAMFSRANSFNQPLDKWDVSNVTRMINMFSTSTSFNQDLSSWAAKFHVDVGLEGFFSNNAWGTTNYDKFLNALWTDINTTRPQAWALRTEPKTLGMGSSKYSAASATARDSLVSNGWTITDGGLAE